MDIFEKVRMRPAQLRTVADRRFEDAKVLLKKKRTNAAMYLAGFAIECLLKAQLLEQFRWLQSARLPKSSEETRLWCLCYRWHDLDEILGRLTGIVQRLERESKSNRPYARLRSICGKWTIFARYSPLTASTDEAREFLGAVEEVRRWLG